MIIKKLHFRLYIDLENYAIVENALYCNFYEKVIGIC